MEYEEIISFIVQILSFYGMYKFGQYSVYFRVVQREQLKDNRSIVEKSTVLSKKLITVEEINGIYYAYDGTDFLAQSDNPQELGNLIANRFPDKYVGARVQFDKNSI